MKERDGIGRGNMRELEEGKRDKKEGMLGEIGEGSEGK